MIVLPWHNPVLLAEQIATLDLLSGGRVDAGIGKGYRQKEFEGFAIPMDEAHDRFEECLAVMLKAWTSDSPWSYKGKYWKYDQVVVEPSSAQKPHPQLWIFFDLPNPALPVNGYVQIRLIRLFTPGATARSIL